MAVPEHYQKQYTREQISTRIAELGGEITKSYADMLRDGEQILAVCVLRGAIFFFADIVREIQYPVEPVFCRAESYNSDNKQATGKGVRVSVDEVLAQGRHILLIDDICDTGLTLLKLHNVFLDLGAKSVRSAVLVHREVDGSKYEPTWSAFNYGGREWFVGYGLDDGGRNRNFPDVYVVPPS